MVLDIVFIYVVFVKKSVLGGDVFFDGCCPHRCLLGCLFSGVPLYTTPLVSPMI